MYAQDSIDLLQNAGIQFKRHEDEGIEPAVFAELLMTSGIVLMDNIVWLSFHSGYDFGYLLKMLTDQNLPADESDFFELLRIYFPTNYDVKYLMKSCKNLKGGLQEVADELQLRRLGPQHQAGSDSHLTGLAFFEMREVFDSIQFKEALANAEKEMFVPDEPLKVPEVDNESDEVNAKATLDCNQNEPGHCVANANTTVAVA